MRKAISECLGIPYEHVRLGRTERGKPILVRLSPKEFNHFLFLFLRPPFSAVSLAQYRAK
jgi:hypothetical protein